MEEHKIIPAKTYVTIWAALVALTALTITVSQMELGKASMLAALIIASVKASLVLAYFMHLKYERLLFKLMFFMPVVTLAVIIGLTFFDILYR
jgi:cytochrome c oxidase subunit 4